MRWSEGQEGQDTHIVCFGPAMCIHGKYSWQTQRGAQTRVDLQVVAAVLEVHALHQDYVVRLLVLLVS